MNTIITIKNQHLPILLQRIGEAIGKGKDLIIQESSHQDSKYTYTSIPGETSILLGMEGESQIKVNQGENLSFSDSEIKEMEEYVECPEIGGSRDRYYCNHICPIRETCLVLV